MEDQETLETSALIGQLPDSVKNQINNLLPDGVVTSSVVIGSILLAGDHLLRVEQLTVGSSTDLVNNSRFQVNEHSPERFLIVKGGREKFTAGKYFSKRMVRNNI